ncbi:hypothetical protein K4B79_18945 [Streptomyces lincolnensis]|uniref:hypothetical protein n=1 Tax=Streptomyces lincolnensis TaxID=1915 RepID=UPI001E441788|nr:hypothetical protein [Streptomyces lincolnensis]MCD7440294.1 hypothetical protein [Streptomyces lincolnensis]
MKNQIPVQAAVVQMLIAKRPRLGQLPIDWQLQHDGHIRVDSAWNSQTGQVVEIAQELARALRGAKVEVSNDRVFAKTGRPYRLHEVSSSQSGVRIYYQGFEYLDGHGDVLPEGGVSA